MKIYWLGEKLTIFAGNLEPLSSDPRGHLHVCELRCTLDNRGDHLGLLISDQIHHLTMRKK